MECLFAKILIFVYLMEMYDNITKKLGENTTLKMYMSYVVKVSPCSRPHGPREGVEV